MKDCTYCEKFSSDEFVNKIFCPHCAKYNTKHTTGGNLNTHLSSEIMLYEQEIEKQRIIGIIFSFIPALITAVLIYLIPPEWWHWPLLYNLIAFFFLYFILIIEALPPIFFSTRKNQKALINLQTNENKEINVFNHFTNRFIKFTNRNITISHYCSNYFDRFYSDVKKKYKESLQIFFLLNVIIIFTAKISIDKSSIAHKGLGTFEIFIINLILLAIYVRITKSILRGFRIQNDLLLCLRKEEIKRTFFILDRVNYPFLKWSKIGLLIPYSIKHDFENWIQKNYKIILKEKALTYFENNIAVAEGLKDLYLFNYLDNDWKSAKAFFENNSDL